MKRYPEYNYTYNINDELTNHLAKAIQKKNDQELLDRLIRQAKETRKQLLPSSRVGRGLVKILNAI